MICEKYVRTILPSVRALLVKKLVTKYGLTQTEVARLLGMSQSVVSRYIYGKRGSKTANIVEIYPTVERLVEEAAEKIYNMKDNVEEVRKFLDSFYCKVCMEIRKTQR